jgi:hypothetical protein
MDKIKMSYVSYYFKISLDSILNYRILLAIIVFLIFKSFDESFILCDDGQTKAETEEELVNRLIAEVEAEDAIEGETFYEKLDRL